MRPPYQIHLPCTWVGFEQAKRDDGDTITIQVTGPLWRIRLDGINTPEKETSEGMAVKHFVESLIDLHHGETSIQVILNDKAVREIREQKINLLNYISFNRLPGNIWTNDEQNLIDMFVERGMAERR